MKIPTFPECDRQIIQALNHHSDYELVNMLQKSPSDGKYFTALFCRYSPVVYSLIRHSAKSPVQANYLFALTWRHILNELGGIDLGPYRPQAIAQAKATGTMPPEFSLQGWLINLTAAHINQAALPEVESIHYSLAEASPPLWCYTERALDSLSPRHRLIVLMAQTFEWSETRIAAYLQAEGEQTSPQAVQAELGAAYQALERSIPTDIAAIYLDSAPAIAPSVTTEVSGRATLTEKSARPPTPDALPTIEFEEIHLQA